MTSVAPPAAVDPAWRRLSTRMLVVHPLQELFRALPALLGLLIAGSRSGNGLVWSLAGVAVAVGLGLLRWFTTKYRVTADRVQVRRGLLRRRLLAVSRDRVRTVDVTAHALHRFLGLARVTLGTGRSDRSDDVGLRLDGLTASEAAGLRAELLHSRVRTPALDAAPAEIELARVRPEWVRYGPFTLSGILAVGVIAGFLSQLVSEGGVDPGRFGPLRDVIDWLTATSLGLVIVVVALAAVAFVAAASTIGYVLAFWRFRLTREAGGTLHVSRGLLTTRATTIEERRLHGVELSEPLLLRAVGGARCIAIATGLRVGRGAERGGSLLLPPAPLQENRRVAAEVLRAHEPVTCALPGHGPRARTRRFTRALAGCGCAVAAAIALSWWGALPAWTWIASLALLPAGAVLAADRYASLGHAVAGGRLVAGRGSLVRRRGMLSCEGIIGFNVRRSFFQRRAGLATLTATTAAGRQGYDVQDVPLDEALRVAEQAVPGLLAPFLGEIIREPRGGSRGPDRGCRPSPISEVNTGRY